MRPVFATAQPRRKRFCAHGCERFRVTCQQVNHFHECRCMLGMAERA
jgi:hypothetical protein